MVYSAGKQVPGATGILPSCPLPIVKNFCSKYYEYAVSNQGVKETHGDNYTLDYFTDVIKAEAVKFIEESSDSPMFMYIATPAPHRPATPAPQYESKFVGQVAPRSPSYDFDSKDKHWIISEGK